MTTRGSEQRQIWGFPRTFANQKAFAAGQCYKL